MKSLLLLFIVSGLAFSPARGGEKKHYALYATLVDRTLVELADGSKWSMDKGDTFPVVMFKEQQTKAILQLAGTTFVVGTDRLKMVEENDLTPEQLASYRHNVETYISTWGRHWKERAAPKN